MIGCISRFKFDVTGIVVAPRRHYFGESEEQKKIENLLTDQSSKFHLDDFAESMSVVFSVCHER